MAGLTLDTAALRMLAKRIDAWIRINADNLAIGSSLVHGDANATLQAYSSAVGYVKALNDVLTLCQEVESDLIKGE